MSSAPTIKTEKIKVFLSSDFIVGISKSLNVCLACGCLVKIGASDSVALVEI